VVLTPAPQKNGGFGGVSSDAAPAASFSPLFDKTLCINSSPIRLSTNHHLMQKAD